MFTTHQPTNKEKTMYYSIMGATIHTYLNLKTERVEKLLVSDTIQIPELSNNSTSQEVLDYNRLLTFHEQERNALVFTRDQIKSIYEALEKMQGTREDVLNELFDIVENMLPDMNYYDDSIKGL